MFLCLQVRGFILRHSPNSSSDSGQRVATLAGKWDSHLHFIIGDLSAVPPKDEGKLLADAQLLWRKAPDSPYPSKYTFSPFCITLNEITPGLEVRAARCPQHFFKHIKCTAGPVIVMLTT